MSFFGLGIEDGGQHAPAVQLLPRRDLMVIPDLAGGAFLRFFTKQRFQPELRVVGRKARPAGFIPGAGSPPAEGVHFMDEPSVNWPVTADRSLPLDLAEVLQWSTYLIDPL